VGEHVARHAAAEGKWRVAGTFLGNPIAIPGVATVGVDLSDAAAAGRLIRDMRPAAVIHCAAATNGAWCEANPAPAHAAIVGATANLCAAMGRWTPAAPLIALSTDLVFDGESAPYAEDAPAKPIGVYGSLKLAAEEPVRAMEHGCVLRSALVYGPPATHRAPFLGWMIEALGRGGPLDLFRDEWRTPVMVDDLAEAMGLLLAHRAKWAGGAIFHAGGADRLSRVEMGRKLCAVFGLPPGGIRETERAAAPGGAQRPRDVSLRHDRLAALGWKPTTFDEGLIRCRNRWNSPR